MQNFKLTRVCPEHKFELDWTSGGDERAICPVCGTVYSWLVINLATGKSYGEYEQFPEWLDDIQPWEKLVKLKAPGVTELNGGAGQWVIERNKALIEELEKWDCR